MSEKSLHRAVCDYIKYRYKSAIFNTDLSGATKLTIGQAVAMKNLRSQRGFPDIVIYEPKIIDGKSYHGLFLELKKEGTKLFNKSGNYATPHIAEQVDCLTELRERGYMAEMVVGFDEAKNVIDRYLSR